MSIWRFTGNPENWITAISLKKWAVNENNKSLWENKIKPGDTVIMHSTAKSDYNIKPNSMVIGLAYIGDKKYVKEELLWIQETRDNQNYWPYVIPLTETYLFSNTESIDFERIIQDKDEQEIIQEIKKITKNGIPLAVINQQAKMIDNNAPNFPVNGSVSGVNKIYEELIISNNKDFYKPDETQTEEKFNERIALDIDKQLEGLTRGELMNQARHFIDGTESHKIIYGKKKVRIENQRQKRIIAKIENYTCQVCGFACNYEKNNGGVGHIIHVDHIIEKSDGGGEELKNLWTLCPNCHSKKTYGVIRVDLDKKKIYEDNAEISIKSDNHLFVNN